MVGLLRYQAAAVEQLGEVVLAFFLVVHFTQFAPEGVGDCFLSLGLQHPAVGFKLALVVLPHLLHLQPSRLLELN